MGRFWALLFAIASFGACSESGDPLPTGSSFASAKAADSNLAAATLSAVVTNALDGQPVPGITVEIPGIASATTGGDGAFTLDGAAAGPTPVILRGDGFHTRETHMIPSVLRAEIDVLPTADKFDLFFFDHVFRNLGADHTERWTQEPRFELWSGIYQCKSGEFEDDCDSLVALGGAAPGQFLQIARDVIAADAPKYTGGAVAGNWIMTREPHAEGTELTWRDAFLPLTITVILVEGIDYSYAWLWPYSSGAMYSATLRISRREHRRFDLVYSHELAHAMGFHHPQSYENVPLPSIMRYSETPSPHDMLHGRILYRRPPGSRTADKDPETFVVNALRDEADAGPPDPSWIRLVRD